MPNVTSRITEEQHALFNLALKTNALRFGDFQLKNGQPSPYFFNAGEFNSAQTLAELAQFYAKVIIDSGLKPTHIYGPAYKGIPLCVAVATALYNHKEGFNTHWFFDRKETKQHGDKGDFVGHLPDKNSVIVVVDDVITDGATKRLALGKIEHNFGCRPRLLVIALDRMESTLDLGIEVKSLLSLEDIIAFIKASTDTALRQHLPELEEYHQRKTIKTG